MKPTMESLNLLRAISEEVSTWHHHHHILLDLAWQYHGDGERVRYAEIGTYAGASACLMLQRPNTLVVAIDTGWFFRPEVVEKNLSRWNRHGNPYRYLVGDAHAPETILALRAVVPELDILFIDGDHDYGSCLADFFACRDFVRAGGFIVFDDYNDPEYPGVKAAVDGLSVHLRKDWLFWGTFKNILGARGFAENVRDGNCYVIRRRSP